MYMRKYTSLLARTLLILALSVASISGVSPKDVDALEMCDPNNRDGHVCDRSVTEEDAANSSVEDDRPVTATDSLAVEAIRKIVRDYLLEHPEVLLEVQEALAAKQAEREGLQAWIAIQQNRHEIFEDPAAPVGGNLDGAITIVEFFDYRCSYCRRAKLTLDELLVDYTDIRIVYKELPILGPGSTLAARAALASHAQGIYLAFHSALMKDTREFDLHGILAIAESVGVDLERLTHDMEGEAIGAIIQRNHALAGAIGISATPSFVIGGHVIRGVPTLAQFRSIVADERKKLVKTGDGS